ncbi:methionyl aminopeptidase [Clostridium acetobutylicum]|jgi:methionyl aminopeptidase|uniref:Methionine aminopeptidase n=1 Tax=Clostridium acetobutylicum (strain ATCC 824 / DSM 792 / JCM 1419 / IAM 19013 / LMG 5710 / NBRC 13948 / NRRL B-527 / VKM B-1787 / 2291 / W) TaxID=272562 RepID=MAP1_CLOAB|nr:MULTISPECIES: type I methionyl aminopeptidase [Clostridium]P69000.1 RecName: Full=Methionine aminopeptidase; Short=MAP; Short=MetAP; AltName: Full=Peptidase M [Clostridium acetobutylicum ATCC 824]ADZ22153.1 Methionine aminopeptidase (MAP) [Clostridium acetobutylicum EA 2018]AEI32689.1 Methionine aminopeptidase (MAP) [Clostridium acetobutylicum DSM 1731]AWV78539.1 methionine aminopeptidase [Clostridium acetobutylicum]MBC2393398.1 type I methionyl aminopeptidase [Clostridium acetobutylicum]M
MIIIKNDTEIEYMRQAGKIVGETLNMLEKAAKPGVTTADLDRLAEDFIKKYNAIPSFKGYGGFPASICTSINEEVIHGIPSKHRVLHEGDIISVDCGAILNGYQGDAARTFAIGEISEEAAKLIKVTKESFFKGVEKAVIGNRLTDISHSIQEYVESFGYGVVRDYVGHGIGKEMHEDPEVPNYGRPGRGPKLVHGMVLAIEPMVDVGTYMVKTQSNDWTVVTQDGSLAAHYENTVAILDNGPEILTLCE